jgi:hypothetical protein
LPQTPSNHHELQSSSLPRARFERVLGFTAALTMKQIFPIILAAGSILLAGGAFGGENVGVGDIRITFAAPSVAPGVDSVPREAYNLRGKEDRDNGALTNIAGGRISALDVTWCDVKFARNEEEVRDFLRQLLRLPDSATYKSHIWSFGDSLPNVVATVQHTEGKPGKLFIWCNPSPALYGAYLDGNGNWWWVYWPVRVPVPFSINKEALAWGEMEGGLQMAAAVDETNGVIHCWVRNGGEKAVKYNDFDFGYWENTGLEIRQGTNWVRLSRAGGGSYSGAGPAGGKIRALAPKEVMTGGRWLHYDFTAEYGGSITAGGLGLRRPASFFDEDTFALDLRAFQTLAVVGSASVQARVRQKLSAVEGDSRKSNLYSPVLILDGAALKFLEPEDHEIRK